MTIIFSIAIDAVFFDIQKLLLQKSPVVHQSSAKVSLICKKM